MDLLLREKEHSAQADRINLNSKVADTVEDVNKRLLSKEIKIREEMQDRYLQLERVGVACDFYIHMPVLGRMSVHTEKRTNPSCLI